MVITEEVAAQFEAAGATVEAVKPKIDKTRTKFETLFVSAGCWRCFNYLVSVSGGTELKDLTNSTSVSASKKELYALIEDQVENGAVEFEKPAIFFMERGTGGKVLFGMELVLTSENAFGWEEIFTDDSVEYPEIVEAEETEA